MEVTTDSNVFPNNPPRFRGYYALILGSVVLVSVTTASSPIVDGPLWSSNMSEGSHSEAPRRTDSRAALSRSGTEASGPLGLTLTAALTSLPEAAGKHSDSTDRTAPAEWGLSRSLGIKVLTSTDSSLPHLEPHSTPPLSTSVLGGWSWGLPWSRVRPMRDLTSAPPRLLPSRSWLPDPNLRPYIHRGSLSSSLEPGTMLGHHLSLSQLNVSAAPVSDSIHTVTTPSGLSVPKSLQRTQGSGPLEQHNTSRFTTVGSVRSALQEPASSLGFPNSSPPAGQASSASDYSFSQRRGGSLASLPLRPSRRSADWDHLQASRDSAVSDAAQGIHLLLNLPEVVAPSYVPFRPHALSTPPELTVIPPEDHSPASTAEADWGSGDYLETISFMGSEGDDFSLVTSLPTKVYEWEDSGTEVYDTSFPSRVVPPLSTMHISSSPTFTTAYSSSLRTAHPGSAHPAPSSPTPESLSPFQHGLANEGSELDWPDTFPVEPTEILLPDMNSLEYYTTLLAKGNNSTPEHRGNRTSSRPIPHVPLGTAHIMPTLPLTLDSGHMQTTSASSSEVPPVVTLGPGVIDVITAESQDSGRLHLMSVLTHTLEPSVSLTLSIASLTLLRSQVSATPTLLPGETSSSVVPQPSANRNPGVTRPSSGITTQWVIFPTSTETTLHSTAATSHATPMLTTPPRVTPRYSGPSSAPPVMGTADQDSLMETASFSMPPRETTTSTPFKFTTLFTTTSSPVMTTPRAPLSTTTRQYLCNITRPDMYLVRVGLPLGSTTGYAKSLMRDVLKSEFNCSVELQVLKAPPDFTFRVVSGPAVYTEIAVINALHQSPRSAATILSASPVRAVPDPKFQVHSVLQFVPNHMDVRTCIFSERVERGLTMAYAEVRRRSQESTNFTVHIVNITMNSPKAQRQERAPVDITFAMRDANGYLRGSDVSGHLRLLSVVEFSFYLGFPVLQLAEPFHYPELNVTQLLKSSWIRTVLLGVLDQQANERTFQAKMERRLALLLGEALGTARRWRRATIVGNNSVQIVRMSRLEGSHYPLEMVYFVEGPSGQRVPAVTISNMLNRIDVQRAAIVLGYRVQGTLAQPVEKMATPPSETQSSKMWIIVGVVVPVLVVLVIIIILYWKLCRTDKLEFQPDAMTAIQQRQKSSTALETVLPGQVRGSIYLNHDEEVEREQEEVEGVEEEDEEEVKKEEEKGELQAPIVKGFDFAKLHLGQRSKDDITVIQEPIPLPMPVKEVTPSENGDAPTPKSKASSTKASRPARRRGRISPSDSMASEASSGKESNEDNQRAPVPPSEAKQPRKNPKNGPPLLTRMDEQLSSTSIFKHVDRMSRSSDSTRRVANKIQLIAMQPMPAPPQHSPAVTERVADSANIKEEVALRHKSEIEHHRNKIRLRAKRRGHYDFPVMDDLMDSFGDPKDPNRVYQKVQMQIDKILDPDAHMPSVFVEPKKSVRGKWSPNQRRKPHMNGGLTEADRDRLLPDSDGTYRKYPGVNNIAYVSDPDQLPEIHSPSPNDDPSIEEARQQMHSLLDDAFALVSPSSQGSTPGIALPAITSGLSTSSPPARVPRGPAPGQWGSAYPSAPSLSPFSARCAELGMSPPSVQSLMQRQGLGSSYLPPADSGRGDQIAPDTLYSSRGLYSKEPPSSARPRPVGSTTGSQLHHLTQVGLLSRITAYPGVVRGSSGQSSASVGGQYHPEEEYSRATPSRDTVLESPDTHSSSMFQMTHNALREPSAPPTHLDPPEESSPPGHSSASLIKAIREELIRLSQKQAVVPSYHS
ncbi:hypothetical protein MATL_G00257970 [Megalops atlanticus]|uniref:Uncharacterized protein n=1 Tax=Megalops atlanticus TaxID=7932 RepID=A0A9D3PAN0_MEGAT|nr:hypothetical protein MATL_G00257970 [Megalops atlanticus]